MTPEQIAAGLSKAQRKALLLAEVDGHLGNHFIRWGHARLTTLQVLKSRGLGFTVWSGVALTPLGQQVRAILKEQTP